MAKTRSDSSSRLQAELHQHKPFRSREQEAVLALVRTSDVVRRRIAGVIEAHGISGQQFNVLRILRGARPEALPTLVIAERMIEQTPGITRLLDRLERKGLVRRERCVSDRRQVLCEITAAGLAILKQLEEPLERAHQEALARLTASDTHTLIRILDTLREDPA